MEILLRITADDFCAGAVFGCDPPICIRAADKLEILTGHGLDKCIGFCEQQGWRYEVLSGCLTETTDSGA